MADSIPWLDYGPDYSTSSTYYMFNPLKPPFNDPLVRKAFIAALDREALFLFNKQYIDNHPNRDTYKALNSLTPPEILGRDLGSDFGIPFDPVQARQYFADAGYSNPELFPPVTFMVPYTGVASPGGNYLLTAREAAAMWEEHLDITVKVVDYNDYYGNLEQEAENIFFYRWGMSGGEADPYFYLKEIFYSNDPYNYSGYSSLSFDSLIDQAEDDPSNPESRQLIYLQAERILLEEDAVVIPLWYFTKQ
jgi:ABC-type oligopeptide transport system substrate-binding subunit